MRKFHITHTGVQVDCSRLDEIDINLEDIAHHLTKVQRFGGAMPLDKTYSVAEHCILLAQVALKDFDEEVAAHVLMHDASEAYLGDIVSSLKSVLPEYQKMEDQLTARIYQRYAISTNQSALVKELDTRILLDESLQLIPERYSLFRSIYSHLEPLGVKITGNRGPYEVKARFLELCDQLDISDYIKY